MLWGVPGDVNGPVRKDTVRGTWKSDTWFWRILSVIIPRNFDFIFLVGRVGNE